MARKQTLASKIAEFFDMPPEAVSGMPKMTISGSSSVLIENHQGIAEYGSERIEINGGRVKMRLTGAGLELKSMDRTEMVISGQIFSVEFE